jgi:hypothetical protein
MARNLCTLHRQAGPMEITLWGRAGCLSCKYDPQNFDHEGLIIREPLDVDNGATRCPRCRAVIAVQALGNGAVIVVEPDGTPHRHESTINIPLGLEAREARRAEQKPPTPDPLSTADHRAVRALFYAPEEVEAMYPTPPVESPPWERWQ